MYKPINRFGSRLLPIAVAVVLIMVMISIWNFYKGYKGPQTTNVLIILNERERTCTNEQEDKEIAMARLINRSRSTSSDDYCLIDILRIHFIHPPSDKLPRMSYGLIKTPQADKIDRILRGKVCIISLHAYGI